MPRPQTWWQLQAMFWCAVLPYHTRKAALARKRDRPFFQGQNTFFPARLKTYGVLVWKNPIQDNRTSYHTLAILRNEKRNSNAKTNHEQTRTQ